MTAGHDGSAPRAPWLWIGVSLASVAAGGGVLLYLSSSAHARHDPVHALQQFDALYLDEPAPAAARLDLEPGRPAVVFFCPGPCELPTIGGAQVVRSSDPAVARAYALLREDGRVGTGYALVDRRGRLRYRTFDPGLQQQEIQILVDGLP